MNSWTALLTHSLQHAPLVAIGGVYAWRVTNPKSPEEKEQMIKAADFAFRQAYALCPQSPEALFRYANLLFSIERVSDARLLAETTLKFAPIVTHCQARNLAGGGAHTCYCDSWNWRDVVIEDNKFESVREGVSVGFVANHIDGLMIRSNIITVADGGVGINFWLSMKNPSQCFVTNLVISGNQIYPGMRAVNTSGLALYGTISASIINNVLQGKGSGHDFDASREVSLVPPYVGEVRIKDFTGNVNVSGVPVEQVQPRLPGH
jgi:hypothetical protein